MAIYIPGLTDYVPAVQPFQPDFNFYAGALQIKQGQYDAAYKELSSVYGTMMYSPMLRDSNIQKRDEFFKQADAQIKKISGLDLSREENVDAAMTVFKPFYEDKNIVKDMVWTKKYQKELARGENFRNCIDPKQCGGQYWDGGIRALNYKADEFRKATDEDALGFSNPEFTPFVNATAKALEVAKEAGFNIKVDTIRGGYIVTTKNGQQLEAPLYSYLTSILGSDPALMDVFRTQAYLQRKDFVSANAATYGGEERAEAAYLSQIQSSIIPQQKAEAKDANDIYNSMATRKDAMDKNIQKNGILPNSQEHKDYFDLQQQLEMMKGNKDFHDQSSNMISSAANLTNLQAMRARTDDIVAYGMFSTEMQNAAHMYAYRDYEESIQADPFALATHQADLSLRNQMTMFGLEQEAKQKEKEAEAAAMEAFLQQGGYDQPIIESDVPGATSKEETSTISTNTEWSNKFRGEQTADKREFLKMLAGELNAQYTAAGQAGVQDGGTKQAMIKESAIAIFKGTGIDPIKVINGTEDMSKIDGLSNSPKAGASRDVNSTYDEALKIINPSTPVWGSTNEFWSGGFWEKTSQNRQAISTRDIAIKDVDTWRATQATNVVNNLAGSADNQTDKDMLSVLTDSRGNVLDEDQFAEAYATKYPKRFVEGREASSGYGTNPSRFGPGGPPKGTADAYIEDPDYQRELAHDEYERLVENFTTKYQEIGKAYDGSTYLGGAGGGKTTMAESYTVDPKLYDRQGALHASSIFRNYQSVSSDPAVKVKFGDAGDYDIDTENQAAAKEALNLLMGDYFRSAGSKDEKRPVFKMRYQNVAGYDSNLTAITFFPSESWAKQYKGSAKAPGPLAKTDEDGNSYANGITVFIPKDKASNTLYSATQHGPLDFVLDHQGFLEMNDYPKGGSVTLKKSPDGSFSASGYVNGYDPKTFQLTPIPINEFYQSNIDPNTVYSTWTDLLKRQSDAVRQDQATLTQINGVKDPAKLPPPQN